MQHALQTVTKNAAEEVVQNTGTPKQKTSWIFIRNKMNAPELSALLTLQALAYNWQLWQRWKENHGIAIE